jgi:transcriptional regulator with XRE-family HTH domain
MCIGFYPEAITFRQLHGSIYQLFISNARMPSMTIMAFGDDLHRLRREAGLTQQELAEKAGISRQYLSLVEANRRGVMPETAEALARALQLEGDQRSHLVAAAHMTQGSSELLELLRESRDQVKFLTALCGLGVPTAVNPDEAKRYGQEVAERLATHRRVNQRLYDLLMESKGKRKPPRMTGFDELFPETSPKPADPRPRKKGRPPK